MAVPAKVVKDRDLPLAAYALRGSNPRLPLWSDPTGRVDARRVAAAIGQLARLSAEERDEALPYVASAWRRLNPGKSDDQMPQALRKAVALSPGTLADQTLLLEALGNIGPDGTVSAMIAFGLPADLAASLAVPAADGVEVVDPADMHCTIAFVKLTPGDIATALGLIAAAMRVAYSNAPFDAEFAGPGVFMPDNDGDDPDSGDQLYIGVALVDAPALPDILECVRCALDESGIPYQLDHGYVPHVTLAVGADFEAISSAIEPGVLAQAGTDWTVDMLTVAVGDAVMHFPLLAGALQTAPYGDPDDGYGPAMAMAKSVTEERFTLAPLYVPESLDSHGEWMTAQDLQRAVWDYMRAGDRTVRLQHIPETVAGETVEIMTLPAPMDATLTTGDGTTHKVSLPAGTVLQGVVWEPWAWELVKSGKLRGLSLGGEAFRVEQSLAS